MDVNVYWESSFLGLLFQISFRYFIFGDVNL